VTQACRAAGVKVLLTGEGSDELFGGYRWLCTTYDNWANVTSWRRFFLPRHEHKTRKALSFAPFASMPARAEYRNRLVVTMDVEDELIPNRTLARLERVEPEADRAFLAHCLTSVQDYLPWLLHRHDRIGMAASLEMRVPFLENALFDFAFHLPRRAKLHRGQGKWVVKKAAAEVLPANIVYARKKGFPAPGKFSKGTEDLLLGGSLAELMHWPANTTQDIVRLVREDGSLRFHLVGLELWARLFFGGESTDMLGEKLVALGAEARSQRRSPRRTSPQLAPES
jgi:asparagine synthase (glutamine-hydrolysing)